MYCTCTPILIDRKLLGIQIGSRAGRDHLWPVHAGVRRAERMPLPREPHRRGGARVPRGGQRDPRPVAPRRIAPVATRFACSPHICSGHICISYCSWRSRRLEAIHMFDRFGAHRSAHRNDRRRRRGTQDSALLPLRRYASSSHRSPVALCSDSTLWLVSRCGYSLILIKYVYCALRYRQYSFANGFEQSGVCLHYFQLSSDLLPICQW